MAIYGAALHNTFSLISKEMIPVFMIAIKLATCTGCALLGKAWQSSIRVAEDEDAEHEASSAPSPSEVSTEDIGPNETVVSFRKAFVRVAFPMFLVSYFCSFRYIHVHAFFRIVGSQTLMLLSFKYMDSSR